MCVCRGAARSVIYFWDVFGQKPENREFCVVFVNKTMFRSLFCPGFLVVFFGEAFCESFANTVLIVLCCAQLRSFCLESLENTSVFVLMKLQKSGNNNGQERQQGATGSV